MTFRDRSISSFDRAASDRSTTRLMPTCLSARRTSRDPTRSCRLVLLLLLFCKKKASTNPRQQRLLARRDGHLHRPRRFHRSGTDPCSTWHRTARRKTARLPLTCRASSCGRNQVKTLSRIISRRWTVRFPDIQRCSEFDGALFRRLCGRFNINQH